MPTTIINKKERKQRGLPAVKISRRGTMYTSPKEIASSKEGKKLIKKLSKIKLKNNKLTKKKEPTESR